MSTYYVDAATGDDSDTGVTELLAWATIDKAMNEVAAGDKVWVKNTSDYTETATIDTAGTLASYINFEGYETTISDGGKFTIDASGETYGISCTPTIANYCFSNMIIEGASSHGFNAQFKAKFEFNNCEFNDNGGCGVSVPTKSVYNLCKFSGNSSAGLHGSQSALAYCSFLNNSASGAEVDDVTIFSCEFYNNIGYYSIDSHTGSYSAVINCTIDGNNALTSYGIYMKSFGDYSVAINNIIYDTNYALMGTDVADNGFLTSNNLLYSNNTNYYQWPTSTDDSDITASAPGFTDEAGGDYTLASTSAARNAGADASGTSSPGMDIGAHQSADAGSGSSRIIITG